MEICSSNQSLWEEIERSESYLVSCMFDEASSLASSVLKDLCSLKSTKSLDDTEFCDMLESATMVLVQSLKELGRTREILNELKSLYGSLISIPIDVFISGVCFQVWGGHKLSAREILEEFLNNWTSLDENNYALKNVEELGNHSMLGVEKYLEVVELYVATFIGMPQRDLANAIKWVEKASLPEEKQQELLRRLNSLYIPNVSVSSSSQVSSLADENKVNSFLSNAHNNKKKQQILKLSKQSVQPFWLFRNITLKFGSYRLVLSNGKIMFSCLLLLVFYFLRKKRVAIKSSIKTQALSLRNTSIDLWQLAFSYQVNPLAVVEPMARGTR
ncbi:protein APEM9 [Impatiens glandulifera]|uniref:protein APEM9 n=1 Tax=Impatiens glandulifera TaxID=253017 RepID=UPI001FB06F16|nr:protein APEM9 [Impatiens glandulifera]